jgi:hypothetical protein
MQNEECIMHNEGISFGNDLKNIHEVDTLILHFALCRLGGTTNYNLKTLAKGGQDWYNKIIKLTRKVVL